MKEILIFCFIFLWSIRIVLSYRYFKKRDSFPKKSIEEREYSVIQAVLSGDPRLEEDLSANILQFPSMSFHFLVDDSDPLAQEICQKIQKLYGEETKIYLHSIEDVPAQENPKSFKIAKVIPKISTKFCIILDDDSVIRNAGFEELAYYEEKEGEYLLTGIPYNHGIRGLFSQLLASFTNGNSFVSYFLMAALKETKTINGMFYLGRTEMFQKYNAFWEIRYELCDDLALASYLSSQGVTLVQTRLFCNVRNTISSAKQYLAMMKRWLLFSRIYIQKHMSLRFLCFILIPCFLPSFIFLFSLCTGETLLFSLIVLISLFILKASALFFLRTCILQVWENPLGILYEILSDLLLPFLFLYSLLTPPVIRWRNKKILVKDGKIRYERF